MRHCLWVCIIFSKGCCTLRPSRILESAFWMNYLFAFLLLSYALWDGCEGGVTCLSSVISFAPMLYAWQVYAVSLACLALSFSCGTFYYRLLFLGFLCYHITSFLVNGFVVNFIIPYLRLLLFFVESHHFSIYKLLVLVSKFYLIIKVEYDKIIKS